MNYILNIIPSPNDVRDLLAGNVYVNDYVFPDVVDYRPILQPIRDQGEQGTCAAQTASCMKEWQEFHDFQFNEYMSPQFIYNNRSNQESEGMFGRDVMKILHKIGSIPESKYPYDFIQKPNEISSGLFLAASSHKIKGYAKINSIEEFKKALIKNGPCYFAVPVYNYSDTMWKPNNNEKKIGGHAMTCVGYNPEGFIIRNSWGKDWGDNGYTIFPYQDFSIAFDIWTTIDEQSYKPSPPLIEQDTEPAHIDPNYNSIDCSKLCIIT